jgi:serine/threonine protein kinase
MKEEEVGPLLVQMLTVTRTCHAHGIIHRDLKLEVCAAADSLAK